MKTVRIVYIVKNARNVNAAMIVIIVKSVLIALSVKIAVNLL